MFINLKAFQEILCLVGKWLHESWALMKNGQGFSRKNTEKDPWRKKHEGRQMLEPRKLNELRGKFVQWWFCGKVMDCELRAAGTILRGVRPRKTMKDQSCIDLTAHY